MTFQDSNASPTTASDFGSSELKVCIRPDKQDHWLYEGSRGQLEAEGVIPPGTKWPEGTQWQRWEVGSLSYRLWRVRPEGLKGPKRLWDSGDWWRLYCEPINRPMPAARALREAQAAFVAEMYRRSAAGQLAWQAEFHAYWKAHEDKAFHAFKAKVPGLLPLRRGRKPKTDGAGSSP